MIKSRLLYILALTASAVFYIAYEEWISWIILAALLMLPWLSLGLSIRGILLMRIRLDVPERIAQGTEVKVHAEAQCAAVKVPYKCKIRITKPITGESRILNPEEMLPTEHCGALTVSAERTLVYDHLGIFRFKVRNAPANITRVMPSESTAPVPAELTRILARAWKAKRGGGFAENHEIRPYHPGDTLNLIHWKLSAKADELMLREPMEPDREMALLTLDINGTPDELDRKFARLLHYGNYLLGNEAAFEVLSLTANGIENWSVREQSDWRTCVDSLLCAPFAPTGSVKEQEIKTLWHCHIGGEPDEA